MTAKSAKISCWIALACLVVPMFASYFFDDMFSTISYLFEDPARTQLGWDAAGYGLYASGYSVLCVFGGLVVCGILLDKWGVRVTGSIFVGMMAAGAATVLYAITAGFAPERSLRGSTGGYFIPMLVFSSFGVLAFIFSFLLKKEDRKKGYGLELPNIRK